MIVFAEITAQAASLNFPPTLILPIFTNNAPRPNFNNDFLIPKIQTNPSLEETYRRILFIDDEISVGESFYSCMNLLKKSGKLAEDAECTILAEGNGQTWEYPFTGISTDFLPYAIKPNASWHGLIFNLMPDHILEEFQDKVDYRLTPKETACLLFSLPLKDMLNGSPFLNYETLERSEKRLPKLMELQGQWLELCALVITRAVHEQRTKEQASPPEIISLNKLLFEF